MRNKMNIFLFSYKKSILKRKYIRVCINMYSNNSELQNMLKTGFHNFRTKFRLSYSVIVSKEAHLKL